MTAMTSEVMAGANLNCDFLTFSLPTALPANSDQIVIGI